MSESTEHSTSKISEPFQLERKSLSKVNEAQQNGLLAKNADKPTEPRIQDVKVSDIIGKLS